MFYEVIPTEVYRAGGGALTYSSDIPLMPGHIVLIPLGKKVVTGLVSRKVPKVDFPTKPIAKLLHPYPIPAHLLKSVSWLSKYYLSPLPACANLMLPAGLAARGAIKNPTSTTTKPSQTFVNPQNSALTPIPSSHPASKNLVQNPKNPSIPLNQAQKTALQSLQEAPGATRLLRGVTGSGKTNIYLKMALNALEQQKSTILLVPEIALTSQLVKIFEQTFTGRVILIHSNQTLVERRQTWLNILNATYDNEGQEKQTKKSPRETKRAVEPTVMSTSPVKTGAGAGFSSATIRPASPEPLITIGPRSALLAPVHNLGLIIIDEAHESAYYQENTPRYSALRLASFIASQLPKSPCVLGSATPNLIDYHLAKTHHSLVELSEKAKQTAIDPEISLVDLKDRTNFTKNRYFSDLLLTKITNNIQDEHQTLIFHNRRGSAPITICEDCGWQALCPNCYLPLTLHADDYTLSCHLCGHSEKVPVSCPECHHPGVIHKGFGTKLLEAELAKLFPDAKIARFDGDNKKSEALSTLYDDVKTGAVDILIGTQTLARGLDLPHLATVGIVQADAGLALPDFSAEERTFELLTQVIGRVGRGHLDTASVIVQTYQPNHPVLQTALETNFPKFAEYLTKNRQKSHLPPFFHLARLSVTYKTEKTTLKKIQIAHASLKKLKNLEVSPPAPAFHERVARGFTWQIILKSPSRTALIDALKPFSDQSGFSIVLDPPSLL